MLIFGAKCWFWPRMKKKSPNSLWFWTLPYREQEKSQPGSFLHLMASTNSIFFILYALGCSSLDSICFEKTTKVKEGSPVDRCREQIWRRHNGQAGGQQLCPENAKYRRPPQFHRATQTPGHPGHPRNPQATRKSHKAQKKFPQGTKGIPTGTTHKSPQSQKKNPHKHNVIILCLWIYHFVPV